MGQVEWLRPSEIAGATCPSLFKDGSAAEDVLSLKLGMATHSWFLSCMAIVASQWEHLREIFVSDKHFDKGMYTLRFWKHGAWQYVLVDDRIPCDAKTHEPIFSASKDVNEFWVNILMKGYAKLHTCYEAVSGGNVGYGLGDLTGGLTRELLVSDIEKTEPNLDIFWAKIKESMCSESPVIAGCMIQAESATIGASTKLEETDQGLVKGVAYSIVDISDAIAGKWLLRLHNPWGGSEWTGDWSDKWDGWGKNPMYKEKLAYKQSDDGSFWMDSADFLKNFTSYYLCVTPPDTWKNVRFRKGLWQGKSAGGYEKATWCDNPTFKVTVEHPTHGMLVLSQEDARLSEQFRRGERKWDEYPNEIGMVLYKSSLKTKGPQKLFSASDHVQSSVFVTARETTIVLKEPLLPQEVYYVVPSTREAGKEGTFILSMTSEHMISISGACEEQVEDGNWEGLPDLPVVDPDLGHRALGHLSKHTLKCHILHYQEQQAAKQCTLTHKFEDTEFPADHHSLYYNLEEKPKDSPEPHQIEWKRPCDIAKKPFLFPESGVIGDLVQGLLADCWLLSAVAVVAAKPELLKKIFLSTKYAKFGIYVLQFWKNGDWVPVMIDDRIPCDINTGKPLYARCIDPNEIWILLLEKAYAKLHGCYETISGGTMGYGLKDLTGCIPTMYQPQDPGRWNKMNHLVERGHTVLLGIRSQSQDLDFDTAKGLGILVNHGYVILDMKYNGSVPIFQVRNPWGRLEWTGKWSDEWTGWTKELKKKFSWCDEDDGRFWMGYDDMANYFNEMFMCDVLPESWTRLRIDGCWAGDSAVGCMQIDNRLNRKWGNNPCYKFTVDTPTNIALTLCQHDGRMSNDRNWNRIGYSSRKSIGMVLYKRIGNDDPYRRLTANNKDCIVALTDKFSDGRDVSLVPEETLVPSIEQDGEEKPVTYFIVSATSLVRVSQGWVD